MANEYLLREALAHRRTPGSDIVVEAVVCRCCRRRAATAQARGAAGRRCRRGALDDGLQALLLRPYFIQGSDPR